MLVERTLEEVKKIYPIRGDSVSSRQCMNLNTHTCSIVLTKNIHALVDYELWDKILQYYKWFAFNFCVLENKPIYSMFQYDCNFSIDYVDCCNFLTVDVAQIIAYAIGLPYRFPVHHWKTNADGVDYKLRTADIMIDNRVCNLYVDTKVHPDPIHDDSIIYDDNVVTINGKLIGHFTNKDEAEKAHDKEIIDAFGWFAKVYHKDTVLPKSPIFYNPDKLPI